VPAQDGDEIRRTATRQFVCSTMPPEAGRTTDSSRGSTSDFAPSFRASHPDALRAEKWGQLILVHFGDYPAEQRRCSRLGSAENDFA